MGLNLGEVVQALSESYEVKLTIGEKVYKERVYYVPEPLIWKYKPDSPQPEPPIVIMKTATGSQKRPIKQGDKGWEDWIKESQEYEEELRNLRMAARYVLALRDIEYPDLSFPPPLADPAVDPYPEKLILRKKYWLDYTILAIPKNITEIQSALMKLSGLESLVDDTKKNSESSAIPESELEGIQEK